MAISTWVPITPNDGGYFPPGNNTPSLATISGAGNYPPTVITSYKSTIPVTPLPGNAGTGSYAI